MAGNAEARIIPIAIVSGPVQNRFAYGSMSVNGRMPRIENQMMYLRPKRSPSGPPAIVPNATAATNMNRCNCEVCTETPNFSIR